jgi:adhesin/invasin
MNRTKRAVSAVGILVQAVALGSCDHPVKPEVPASITFAQSSLTIQSRQSAELGVTVKSNEGNVIGGTPSLIWASSNSAIITVTAGRVSSVCPVGSSIVTAAIPERGLTASVSVSVTAGPAKTLDKVSDVSSSIVAGGSDSVRVRVSDDCGNGISGQSITFAVVAGGGSVSPTTVATNASGIAAALWTVGGRAGALNSASASVPGTTLAPITLSASPATGPAAKLVLVAGPPSSGRQVATDDSVAVQVTDAFDNPVAGATVAFAVVSGGGELSSQRVTSRVDGRAVVRWTLGSLVGVNALSASLSDPNGPSIAITTVTKHGPAASLTKVRDAAPILAAGAADSIAVRVADAHGNAVVADTVTFETIGGGGSVSAARSVTTATGTAAVYWRTGRTVGDNAVRATVGAIAGGFVDFGVRTIPGARAKLAKLSADPVGLRAGQRVDSIVVLVTDEYDNPRGGDTVSFAATAGGGSVSPLLVITGANGRAIASWQTGAAGANTMAASSGSLTTTFATAVGPSLPVALTISPRVIVVDSGTSVAPTVLVRDAGGNSLAGAPVTLATRAGAIAGVTGGIISGQKRGQAIVVASADSGSNPRDSVLVVVARLDGPVIMTDLARFEFPADTIINVTVIADMRGSGARLGSTTVAVSWDPALLTYQSHRNGSSGVSPTVNSGNAVSGELVVSVADAAGFPGRVELIQLTLRLASSGKIGAIAMSVSELSTAGTFADLLARLTVVTHPLTTR